MIRKIVLFASLFALIAFAGLAWLVYRHRLGRIPRLFLVLRWVNLIVKKGSFFYLAGACIVCQKPSCLILRPVPSLSKASRSLFKLFAMMQPIPTSLVVVVRQLMPGRPGLVKLVRVTFAKACSPLE